ncbi:hypothetical protein BVRB_8g189150 [Beta vulgaris subsp. vulgaris]|nr:hypothetical protein BVRB_8g189150 [Beta vulgaris subsp. vulgaris]
MAATLLCYITGKLAKALIWILMFVLLLHQVLPVLVSKSLHLWILIKRRKFIYVLLNFIIISILVSSSSLTPHVTNFFLKLWKKSKTQKSQIVVPHSDDDTWCLFTFTQMDDYEIDETASFTVVEDEVERSKELSYGDAERIIVEEKEEEDDLDATWKAIMESKEKESGPHLKKSDTWSCGDGVDEKKKEVNGGMMGGLSKYKVGELKKWQSFRDMVEMRENIGSDRGGRGGDGGDSGGDSGGGGERGWRSVEVALTFHDEFKKRADNFIAQFTHDIHLQRLESDQRFLEMINRGL